MIGGPEWRQGSFLAIDAEPQARRRHATPLLYIDAPETPPHHLQTGTGVGASHDPNVDPGVAPAIKCYFSKDMSVSGNGLLWSGDELIVLDDIMPVYWRDLLSGHSAQSTPESDVNLPTRTIKEPCICGIGWGANIYGHVLLEIIPRILLALDCTRQLAQRPKVLLRADAPEWLLAMLVAAEIDRHLIEWFDPKSERVLLEHGIFPANLGITHPHMATLFDKIDKDHAIPLRAGTHYLTRKAFANRRACLNEPELEYIAASEFGASIVAPEDIPWIDQVRLFRSANAVVGLTGSALHTSVASDSRVTIASIGAINRMQSAIGNLRGQRVAYQLEGFTLSGSYAVPADGFRRMMEAVCKH